MASATHTAKPSNKASSSHLKPTPKDNLLKFVVNFRRPKKFTSAGGFTSSYRGQFGFDWLRDEYEHPIELIDQDLNQNPLPLGSLPPGPGAVRTICTNAGNLRTEYLNGVTSKITPYGNNYFPAWLSIFPPWGIKGFTKGSTMHKNGVKLSFEVDEVEALTKKSNNIEFEFDDTLFEIKPKYIKLSTILSKGTKVTKTLNAATGLTRTFWKVDDIITIKQKKKLIKKHTEIKVFGIGKDKKEQVGQLMVYKNDKIGRADLVLVRAAYNNSNINLDNSYHFNLKNKSFNQALIRAEIVADERFIINKLKATDPAVVAFKTNFPKGTLHNGTSFLNALVSLYQKFGKNNPAAGKKRTILFITNENSSNAGGTAQSHGYAAGKYVWGNSAVVFRTNLLDKSSYIHEIGHSLSLAHTFDADPLDAGILHRFYRGYTDNYMDYDTRFGGVANNHKPLYFYKWQWDIIRGDQSINW